MSIETEKFNRIREIANKNTLNCGTVFFDMICKDCEDLNDDICDGLDSDYCGKYERFLKGN